ncbi:MAG: T9SS type A sorting domain-containing protein [Bacteroidota bacterium]
MRTMLFGAIVIFLSITANAQVQRLLLAEEFTNANSGPCAALNPGFNALLLNNPNKIVALKYQTDWPTPDVMNAQNPTEISARINYYGVNAEPIAYLNGSTSGVSGIGTPGILVNFTQTVIDNEYQVPSPFHLTLNHTISANLDSIIVTCIVEASQPINLQQLFLRLAVVEKHIHFNSPPGNNGETDFYYVMRKMLPDATGTLLSDTWTQGQTDTLTFTMPLPSYIYDLTELALIGFLQEDVQKAIQQTAISQPVPLQQYGSVTHVALGNSNISCNNEISPSVTISNQGLLPLGSAEIAYNIDGGLSNTFPFSGNLASGDSANVTIPIGSPLSPGNHTLTLRLNNINGTGIHSTEFQFPFHVMAGTVPANSFQENFTSNPLLGNSWTNYMNDLAGFSWNIIAGYGNPKGALKMDFWSSTSGSRDEIILPPLSCSGTSDATIHFKIAAKGYLYGSVHSQDTLQLMFSIDCGNTWNTAWLKSGSLLATGIPTYSSNEYTGASTNDYRAESAVLPGTGNASELLIKFVAISNNGNNVFIDNINVSALSQKRILAEEFTNANSAPCAAINQGFNSLLLANTDKIVALKYQTDWPTPDPMHSQNPSEINTRINYYNVVAEPVAFLNGSTNALIGTGPAGSIVNFTQQIIDSLYSLPNPFSITLNHSISPDLDSIYITCNTSALQTAIITQLFLRVALVEKHIRFHTPPGNNGETDFYYVMRKMLPNPGGIALQGTWTSGENQTITIAASLPAYIYDPSEIAVVAFLQEDIGKSILHTSFSEPVALPNFASVSNVSLRELQCDTLVNATITAFNQGTTSLNSFVVSYSVDGGVPINIPFSGFLAPGASIDLSLPAIPVLSSGIHTLSCSLLTINGTNNHSPIQSKTFYSIATPQQIGSFTENFNNSLFPYSHWININNDAFGFSRSATAGLGTPKGALKMNYYNSPARRKDEMLLPALSYSGYNDANLTFKIAAKGYLNGNIHSQDTLSLYYSKDCGLNWHLAWQKSGATLATGFPTTSVNEYAGNIDADYRTESVLLGGTANENEVMIKFVAISDEGNNAFIDNINISSNIATEINQTDEVNTIEFYPNPSNSGFTVAFEQQSPVSVIELVDATGKLVHREAIIGQGKHKNYIATANIAPGLYFLKIPMHTTEKLLINH